MGARYLPCMKAGTGLDVECGYFACPDGVKSKQGDGGCYIEDVCDMRGSASMVDFVPNQFWRFFSAVMLHGGVVHLLFNLSFQTGPGFDLERVFYSFDCRIWDRCV
jgi:Rhomboid family